ncbi:MAG: fibrobacter succinogenes major paralogous domain-containing protein [Prevotellaceae bacterium]|jgi:hypothetical protein|nr:fibrobacter succinogenes major paralogous domain-containing protein [Prevotellaceae bacterium]
MKLKTFLFPVLITGLLSVASFSVAQVTIGGSEPPAAGAILDLNSTTKGGLALSNVSIPDLEKIPTGTNLFPGITAGDNDDVNADFIGAIVYNNSANAAFKLEVSEQNTIDRGVKGIFVWDGNRWNSIGSTLVYSLTFAPYNLGADLSVLSGIGYDDLSPAKRQIKYLASCTLDEAYNVWGDHYQWGRVADGHEKGDAVPYATAGALTSGLDGVTGQVVDDTGGAYAKDATNQKYGHLIKADVAPFDWRSPQKDDIWGNGRGFALDGTFAADGIDKGGVLYNGEYYQNTDWAVPANNPCVSMGAGWRVPTQDEWERLMNYDGDPGTAGGSITLTSSTGTSTSTPYSAPLTWVPVKGGVASKSGWTNTKGNLGGIAVYKTADWDDAAAADYKNGTKNLYEAAAPEPILFLPASGYRDYKGGPMTYLGTNGFYWSSTVNDTRARYQSISSSTSSTLRSERTSGFSVRCVKE